MMYWIIFALFTTVEVFTDMFLCWWVWPLSYFDPVASDSPRDCLGRPRYVASNMFLSSCFVPPLAPKWSPLFRLPFYYELKIAFVVWLLSPYTKGSSVLYRKFVHPTLSSKEKVKTSPFVGSTFFVQSMEKALVKMKSFIECRVLTNITSAIQLQGNKTRQKKVHRTLHANSLPHLNC